MERKKNCTVINKMRILIVDEYVAVTVFLNVKTFLFFIHLSWYDFVDQYQTR